MNRSTRPRASVRFWQGIGRHALPFADAASADLPLPRLLRLSLFQVSVGIATALLVGTLNRVMIVELGVAAWLVAAMVALPLLTAPWRARIGFGSDTHVSSFGWRRVPYLWYGTLLQFGGLAIMPFALLILSGDTHGPVWVGEVAAALAFLMVGGGLQTTQTAGLALATDLAPEDRRPRVVALMYVMLLVGLLLGGLLFGGLLQRFTPLRLIQVVQGAAMLTLALNVIALWKQEPRDPLRAQRRAAAAAAAQDDDDFRAAWAVFAQQGPTRRYLTALGLGTAAFGMQDVVLEPYGGTVLGLGVGDTSLLTALFAAGALLGFALAARRLQRGGDASRLAAGGTLAGVGALCAIVFAAPLHSADLFRIGVLAMGCGGGLFSVSMLVAAMGLASSHRGLALGAWGAVQATAAGGAIALAGALRDGVALLADADRLGPALTGPAVGYLAVYHVEIALLFATLVALGPLVRRSTAPPARGPIGFARFPG
ncbi:BCD family MFS transporter [Piscinibacter sakaiensis]|uniref:PucC protein n=1 Tax=Piscinibacter sakaiensis TaxID=1547922 RepID=A0A0K8NVH6_PISS1|nr:BCD family MFS transporter [Piscinibacter sakaiensis]GAP34383.1 PucC protein [Piscinibacter sakaiensis]